MSSSKPVRMENLEVAPDGRAFSPSAARNQRDVVAALGEYLPRAGLVLEVAAGTGEHAFGAVRAMPAIRWLPTDRVPEALRSQRAWREVADTERFLAPEELDLETGTYPDAARGGRCVGVIAINLLHIAPLSTASALFRCAGECLGPAGRLLVYGAFRFPDVETAPSNAAFDERLREADPAFGVRHIDELQERAEPHRMIFSARHALPNNNFLLSFELG